MTDLMTMNMTTTAMSASGLSNFGTQMPVIGTLFGMALIGGLLISIFVGSHSWNTKGLLYRFVKWLVGSFGENVLVGVSTCATLYGVYWLGETASKFGDANPNFIGDVLLFCGEAFIVLCILYLIGWGSKPIWNYAFEYASGNHNKKYKYKKVV